MPLTRDRITVASAIMLPTYAAAFAFNGVALLWQNPVRTSGDAFDAAREVLPMHGWGLLFLAIAALEALAIVTHHRRLEVVALSIGVGLASFWATLLLLSALTGVVVSFTSFTWVCVVAIAHYASMRSLTAGER
jgi:hypothetical protein